MPEATFAARTNQNNMHSVQHIPLKPHFYIVKMGTVD